MTLQSDLELAFSQYQPPPPSVEACSRCDVTLSWPQPLLAFLAPELLFRVQRNEKMPSWVTVYSGGKTRKRIDNLAPCSPHKFRLQVIVKATAVPHLAEEAVEYYGSEEAAYEALGEGLLKDIDKVRREVVGDKASDDNKDVTADNEEEEEEARTEHQLKPKRKEWLESRWSEYQCTSTQSEGTSATCFCMAVQGGYLKQVQILLEERPALIDIVNTTNGYTPLATAVRKGDMNMVRYLLSAGARLEQRSCGGRTALHLATLDANIPLVDLLLERGADFQVTHRCYILPYYRCRTALYLPTLDTNLPLVELLLERGADFQARDINELRVEHYAVDSGDLPTLRYILGRDGDVTVRDNNGWTPLFRAVCQGASTAMVEELVKRGSDVDITDAAGLSLAAAARLLTNRHDRSRESILRLVDSQYPREVAVANFTRLTKKISSVHSLLRL